MKPVTILLLAAALAAPTAGAATIHLTQGGWDQGGPLTLTFTGEDIDLSGGIEAGELTSFAASFAVEDGREATWSLLDLGTDGFFFGSTADYFIKADGPEFSLYETAFEGVSVAIVSEWFGPVLGLSGDSLTSASSVPEPGTGILLSASVLALAIGRRLRCRRHAIET